MALDSNTQVGRSGSSPPHFTPFPIPGSRGVIGFTWDIAPHENAYVCPPFVLIGPLLCFLGAASFPFTIVVPKLAPPPYWWPLIQARASRFAILGRNTNSNILLFPSPHDVFSALSLPWDLLAFRITNLSPAVLPLDKTSQNVETGYPLP